MSTMVEVKSYKNADELAPDLLFDYVNIHCSENRPVKSDEQTVTAGVCMSLKDYQYFTVSTDTYGAMSEWWTAISVTFRDYAAPYVVLIRNGEDIEYHSMVFTSDETDADFKAVVNVAKNYIHPHYNLIVGM